MATQLTTRSADVNNNTGISTQLRRSLIIVVVFTVLIIGAVGYGLSARWSSMQGGPEMAPGNCSNCHQGPMLGFAAPQFSAPMV
jgi:hypothetical protein